jgi:pimeloyl-ACP methyl ester carboxylesterase
MPAATPMPLVLLPGLLCDRAVWDGVPGFPDKSAWIVPFYADQRKIGAMAQIVLEAAPPRFALASHSMGGRVALEILRVAPGRVERVALLDTGFLPRPAGEAGKAERAGRMALLDVAYTRGMRAMGRQWLQRMVHPSRLEETPLIDSMLDMIERQTPAMFAAQIEALLDRPDASDVLAHIECPTLILCGRDDAWSPLSTHHAMHVAIPGSCLVAIPDCGHMSTMERPAAVGAALRDWLSRTR